jgi:hypothetical protein
MIPMDRGGQRGKGTYLKPSLSLPRNPLLLIPNCCLGLTWAPNRKCPLEGCALGSSLSSS